MCQHRMLGEFESGKEDWKLYTERLEQYFTANDITEVAKKRADLIILWCNNLSAHERCFNASSPISSLFRGDSHNNDRCIITEIMQRYCFNSWVRRPREFIATNLANPLPQTSPAHFHHTQAIATMVFARIERRTLTLADYDYTISYKLGDTHGM